MYVIDQVPHKNLTNNSNQLSSSLSFGWNDIIRHTERANSKQQQNLRILEQCLFFVENRWMSETPWLLPSLTSTLDAPDT